MHWLTTIFVMSARLILYFVILSWVIVGQIKPPHLSSPTAAKKGRKTPGSTASGAVSKALG